MIFWQAGITLEEMEKRVILEALKYYNQNRTHAAAALGITTRTIQNKLHSYGMGPAANGEEDHEAFTLNEPTVEKQKKIKRAHTNGS